MVLVNGLQNSTEIKSSPTTDSQPGSQLWQSPEHWEINIILFQSTHFSSVQLSATKFHFHSLLSQMHDDEKVPPSPDRLSIPVLNVLKCCQSAHISSARQANRINPGLTHQAWVQGNGLG